MLIQAIVIHNSVNQDGTTFEAVAVDDVDLAAGKFAVGADLGQTSQNLVDALNAAGTNVRFGAVRNTDNTDPLDPQYSITLSEKTDQVAGDDDLDMNEDFVQEVRGVYTFDVEDNFTDGDKLTIDGRILVAGTDFTVGADADATAAAIMGAINANATLSDRFTAYCIGK